MPPHAARGSPADRVRDAELELMVAAIRARAARQTILAEWEASRARWTAHQRAWHGYSLRSGLPSGGTIRDGKTGATVADHRAPGGRPQPESGSLSPRHADGPLAGATAGQGPRPELAAPARDDTTRDGNGKGSAHATRSGHKPRRPRPVKDAGFPPLPVEPGRRYVLVATVAAGSPPAVVGFGLGPADPGDDGPLIDPDCRDGKCGSCVGGPCQHPCHDGPPAAALAAAFAPLAAAAGEQLAGPVRCPACGYLTNTTGHRITCGSGVVA